MFPFHDILAETVQGGGQREGEEQKSFDQKFPDFTAAAPTRGSHWEKDGDTEEHIRKGDHKDWGMPSWRHCPYVRESAYIYPLRGTSRKGNHEECHPKDIIPLIPRRMPIMYPCPLGRFFYHWHSQKLYVAVALTLGSHTEPLGVFIQHWNSKTQEQLHPSLGPTQSRNAGWWQRGACKKNGKSVAKVWISRNLCGFCCHYLKLIPPIHYQCQSWSMTPNGLLLLPTQGQKYRYPYIMLLHRMTLKDSV